MKVAHRLLGQLMRPVVTFTSQRRLPRLEGRLPLDGLEEEVAIRRDRWGIPHIDAQSRHDLFFAQGVVHAQDRLWQLEINRRAANGTVAALVGQIGLETDRLSRTLGFRRRAPASWERVSGPLQACLQAYVAGINAYLDSNPPLPVEFSLLRHRPQPWHVLDVVAFAHLQMFSLSFGWGGELVRAELVDRLGQELAAELDIAYRPDHPVHLPQGIEFNRLAADGMLQALNGPYLDRSLEGGGRGSNAWVIAASRSASGHAILANDMHLPLTNPALWYFQHLRCHPGERPEEAYHCAGVTMPGMPLVLVGHNEHIAWGATLSYADVEDLFIEKLHPEERLRYAFRDQWLPLEVVEERIEVKGAADHVEQVRLSHHGPLLSSLVDSPHPLALSSMALRSDAPFDGFAAINDAQEWDEFVAAVSQIHSPSLSLVYADVADNIGYYVSGQVPVRAAGVSPVPAEGWSGEFEWEGTVPFAEMPHALNPRRGYVISCNHKLTTDDYPHDLGHGFVNGFRARRLEELFAARETISVADCRQFQHDLRCLPALELVARLKGLETDVPDAALGLSLLRAWDGWLGAGSAAGAVYELLLARLAYNILNPTLGDNLYYRLLGQGPHAVIKPKTEFYGQWVVALLRMLDNPHTLWLGGRYGRESVLVRSLAEAVQELRRLLGNDPYGWQWGKLHQVRFYHAMGLRPPLDQVFNVGPFPHGGDPDTVAQAGGNPEEPYETNAYGVSYRQIIDMGRLSQAEAIYAPGQSGQIGSRHYDDLVDAWREGGYFAVLWREEEVAEGCRHTLTLVPQPAT